MHILHIRVTKGGQMSVASKIEKMEAALADTGLSVRYLCDRAEVNQSTWCRWKTGANTPNMSTWGRVERAFDELCPTPKDADAGEAA